jgi:L-rhamnose mutarotase
MWMAESPPLLSGKPMERLAFKMKLNAGQLKEYKKRHAQIWPELQELLRASGIHDYSIFFDEETNNLFATLKVDDRYAFDQLPNDPLMKKWWAFMKDIMATNSDHSPVSIHLKEVFHLP